MYFILRPTDGASNSTVRSAKSVDLDVLTSYLTHLHERQLAATSIARHLISIKMYFRYLVLEGVLLESAVELLESPKLWEHLPKVLSPNMVDELLLSHQSDCGRCGRAGRP